jgi:hypothetical protein
MRGAFSADTVMSARSAVLTHTSVSPDLGQPALL